MLRIKNFKILKFFNIALIVSSMLNLIAQDDTKQNLTNKDKYQRSSLTMILLQGTKLVEDKSTLDYEDAMIDNSPSAIRKLWDNYPFPELYDKHEIVDDNISVYTTLSSDDIFNAKKNKRQLKNAQEAIPKIKEELKNKRIAHQVVKRWFSSEDGSKFWDLSTIQKRGFYNATELEAEIAKQDIRGRAKLADAGEQLINNSFVTVTDLIVYSNKPISDRYKNFAISLEEQAQKLREKSEGNVIVQLVNASSALALQTTALGLKAAASAIEDGYTVVSTTYLFKLRWNDEIQAEFYKIWGDYSAFEKMAFELDYIGLQLNETVLNRGSFNKSVNRLPEVVIKQAVVRNIDEAFAKLQKENDVFKPFVPVLSTHPVAAKIGMKEGLTGGEKFKVLQKIQDLSTGKVTYKKVGSVTVDKTHIWDNRYNAGEDSVTTSNLNFNIKETHFKGGRSVVPGMLLKLK